MRRHGGSGAAAAGAAQPGQRAPGVVARPGGAADAADTSDATLCAYTDTIAISLAIDTNDSIDTTSADTSDADSNAHETDGSHASTDHSDTRYDATFGPIEGTNSSFIQRQCAR